LDRKIKEQRAKAVEMTQDDTKKNARRKVEEKQPLVDGGMTTAKKNMPLILMVARQDMKATIFLR
jgi:CO dehydrogenase/acetyl-CoA synthase alpha subunit